MKLHIVTITYTALALAESEADALSLADDIERDEPPNRVAAPFFGELPPGWDMRCGVYHAGSDNIDVRAAIRLHEASKGGVRWT